MKNYREMLEKLLDELGAKHIDFYFEKSKEDVEILLEKTLKKFKLENDYDFFYVSTYLIKHIIGNFDEHTGVYIDNQDRLPLTLKIFNNKIYMVDCHSDLRDYKFKEITAINEIDIKQLFKETADSVCYVMPGWLDSRVSKHLSTIAGIKSLPSINENDDIIFTFENRYQVNITDVFNKASIKLPERIFMSYEMIDDIIKINYKQCAEQYDGQMQDLISNVKALSEKNNISKYIVDLRGNTGGNSKIIKPLIEFLNLNEIITLVDIEVFSSGLFACTDLKNIGSKFVGTDIGTTYNRFGENKFFTMENFEIAYSSKYFYYDSDKNKICSVIGKDDFLKFKNDKNNIKYFDKLKFKIDKYAEETLEDYINGYDASLEEAKKLLNKIDKKVIK